MTTYTTNEIHPNSGPENHNALYMVVGIILALMIAAFAFYYYTDRSSTSTTNDSAGTIVERTLAPASGDKTSESDTLNMSVDDNGVSATRSTTTQQ